MKRVRSDSEFRLKWWLQSTLFLGGFLIGLSPIAGSAGVELDVIVKDGDPAPASNGDFNLAFSSSGYPALAINADALVYFFATSSTSISGIWWGSGEYVDDVAVDGQVLPNFQPSQEDCEGFGAGCGQIFNTRSAFYVSNLGEIVLQTNRDDNIGRVAQLAGFYSLDIAPLITDVQVANFPVEIGLQTDAGGYLIGPYSGSAPFGEPTGGLEDFTAGLIGGPAPSIPDPVTIDDVFGTYGTSIAVTFGLNENDDRLFVAELSDESEALYLDIAGATSAPKLLARSRESAPGIAGAAYATLSTTITAGQTGRARLNDAADGYFMATWHDPDGGDGNDNLPRRGIWRFDSSGTPLLVVSEYQNPAFDPVYSTSEFESTAFESISLPHVAPNGDVYFYGKGRDLLDGGIPDTSDERVGLWRYSVGTAHLDLILRVTTSDAPGSSLPNGPNVPGTPLPGGGNFTGFGLSFYGIDEHGHLVFDTSDAIYAEDTYGLRLILKKGQEVEIEPGDIRTVGSFRINNFSFVGNSLMGYRNDRLTLRARFTDGSNAILRTRFLPPPPPPKLVGLEAVQVVQDWENSVTLYAGKTTLVRAHFRSDESRLERLDNFVLRVFDAADEEFPFSPVLPDFSGGMVLVGPDSEANRGAAWSSANFILPDAAVAGPDIKIKVGVVDGTIDCDEIAGTWPYDCTLEMSFTAPNKPQVKLVSLNWLDPSLGELRRVDRASRIELIERLISIFPIAEVDWSDLEVRFLEVPTLDRTLTAMERLRVLDGCSTSKGCQRMYYGAVRDHSLNGVAYVDHYVGTGFVHPNPHAQGRHTHSHEIGHNLKRHHSIADPPQMPLNKDGEKQGPCWAAAPVSEQRFPFLFNIPGVGLRQTLGPMDKGDDELVFGFDAMQLRLVDSTRYFDLMGYCSADIIDMWPSTHTYAEVASELAARYPPAPAQIMDRGTPEDFWIVGGTIGNGAVTLDPILLLSQAQVPDVSPAGSYLVRVLDSVGTELDSTSFEPEVAFARGLEKNSVTFLVALPVQAGASRIEVIDPFDAVVAYIEASANPPTVEILSPNGGETPTGDSLSISWVAEDLDGDELTHSVQLSPDNGATWQTLVTDWPELSLTLPIEALPETGQALVRVQTTDGFHIAVDVSDAVFSLPNSPPTVIILKPEDLRSFYGSEVIGLVMATMDSEDGPLSGAALSWESDIDGLLGQGASLAVSAAALSPGTHQLTATATDSGGASGQDSITIIVDIDPPAPMADISVDLFTGLSTPPPAEDPHVLRLHFENAGPDSVDDAQIQLDVSLRELATEPGAMAMIEILAQPSGWSCQVTGLVISCPNESLEAFSEADLDVAVTVDRPALVTVVSSVDSASHDPAGANNLSTAEYLVGISHRVFDDRFETDIP